MTTHDRSLLALVGSIALAALAVAALAVEWWGVSGAVIVAALAIGASAALVDARSGRIPNRLVAAALVPILVLIASLATAGSGEHALGAVALGGLAFAGPIFVVHLVSPRAMGFGDVKLAAMLGATLGLVEPRLGLLALCLAAAVTATIGLFVHSGSLPFGPGLVLGATMALLIAGQLGEEALRWR